MDLTPPVPYTPDLARALGDCADFDAYHPFATLDVCTEFTLDAGHVIVRVETSGTRDLSPAEQERVRAVVGAP
jgi:hypothetical protein